MSDLEELFDIPFGTLERMVLEELVRQKDPVANGLGLDDLALIGKRLQAHINSVIARSHGELREIVCVKLDYCKIRKNDVLDIAAMLIDYGVILYFGLPVGPALLSVYLIRWGALDRLCACS